MSKPKKMTLADLRREIDQDTKAAQAERVERIRQTKEQGPVEYPAKKTKWRDIDLER